MDSEYAGQAGQALEQAARRSWRVTAIGLIGPVTIAAGFGWALVQPYRITLLNPFGQGFWWLFVEPPLYVIGIGLLFALVVAPGLLEDLERAEEET
jgi:hypothetical protein